MDGGKMNMNRKTSLIMEGDGMSCDEIKRGGRELELGGGGEEEG